MTPDTPTFFDRERFKGRVAEVTALRDAILDGGRVAVYGLAGIGKSAIVGAAFAAVKDEIGSNRSYVDCDRHDTIEQIVAVLAADLPESERSSTVEPAALRAGVLDALRRRTGRSLLVFDNLETIWLKQPRGMRSLLADLAEGPNIAVVVAIRRAELPDALGAAQGWTPLPVGRLDRTSAVDLFLSWARRFAREPGREDTKLNQLVNEDLQRVPLAIVLFARQAQADSEASLDDLSGDLHVALIKLPLRAEPRSRSLEASLRFSIDRIRGEREPLLLLALLGALPDGILAPDLTELARALPADLEGAAERVGELGLAHLQDGRLVTLKPIREYLEQTLWPPPDDLATARAHYLGLVGGDDADSQAAGARGARAARESGNVASMAATLPSREAECDALARQGDAELRADEYAAALNSFRRAGELARGARDPGRLALCALGVSGGLTGSGHSFDRADEERLGLLRDANHLLSEATDVDDARAVLTGDAHALLPDDRPALRLRVVVRLLAELHFDASDEANREREALELTARQLEPKVADWRVRRGLALQRLRSARPLDGSQSSLPRRLALAEELLSRASRVADASPEDVRAEAEARQVYVAALLEAGRNEEADAQIDAVAERVSSLPDRDRNRFRAQGKIVLRAKRLFDADYDLVRPELEDEPKGDRTNSPYRRWLHQRVLLALDTEELSTWTGASDWVARVKVLNVALERVERRKFGLADKTDLDATLAYKWWPTWRSTLALVLAARGGEDDRERAHELVDQLSSGSGESDGGTLGFGRILQHEYYVQVLALITLVIERLTALEARHGPGGGEPWTAERERWATALIARLTPFAGQVVVPGSVVMNLGAVDSYRAMLYPCAGDWGGHVAEGLFDKGRAQNEKLGGRAAVVRTLVAQAEVEGFRDNADAAEVEAIAGDALDAARRLGMLPWARRAEALL
jgi:conflict system STAND superfamily ATPase